MFELAAEFASSGNEWANRLEEFADRKEDVPFDTASRAAAFIRLQNKLIGKIPSLVATNNALAEQLEEAGSTMAEIKGVMERAGIQMEETTKVMRERREAAQEADETLWVTAFTAGVVAACAVLAILISFA